MHMAPNLPRYRHLALVALVLALISILAVTTSSVYAQTPGNIQGVVYQDLNTNGARDAGENGIAGVTIRLRNSANQIIATTLTGSEGEFSFAGLAPGVYAVLETDPSGYVSTTPNEVPVSLSAGATVSVEFGNVRTTTAVPPGNGYIWGYVIDDRNGNGVADPGEPGLAGVTVKLYDENGNLLDTVVTDANGFYDFGIYPTGTYTIVFELPAGINGTGPLEVEIELTNGQLITQIFTAREPFVLLLPAVPFQ